MVTQPAGPASRGPSRTALAVAAAACLLVIAGAAAAFPDPKLFRAAAIAGVCLVLWLSEIIPLYATTLVLWAAIAALLGPLDPKAFALPRVLSAAANPVMALFFGGFALSVAGAKYGIDAAIAGWMVRASRGSRVGLLLSVMGATAVLSMWMSNIAAGAMMLATLGPMFRRADDGAGANAGTSEGAAGPDASFRKALLVGVAFAADFGGIGTPIGTGPNLVAIGAVSAQTRIRFLDWMLFGVPLALLMVALAWALLAWRYRVRGAVGDAARLLAPAPLSPGGRTVVALFCVAVAAWVSEPLHGVPAAVTALAVAAALFGSRLLDHRDLDRLEWDTLLLIAGGLTLGELFSASGLAAAVAGAVRWDALPRPLLLLCLVAACAAVSAVASNTATAAMLVQIALGIVPAPSVAVLVALAASMGIPFVISTPPNSMAYGQGGLAGRDFLIPGVVLMAIGCALLAATGPLVLRWAGVP